MIIQSLIDTDFYKITMLYAVIRHFPHLKVRYKFTDRKGKIYPMGFATKLSYEVNKMSELCLTDNQAEFIQKLGYFPPFFIMASNYSYV